MGTESLLNAIALLEARDWQGAHEIAQDSDAPLASWAHGIVHLTMVPRFHCPCATRSLVRDLHKGA